MPSIKLLCTDFDGTLVETSLGRCVEEFAEVLLYQKKKGGAWVINTGRAFQYILKGLEAFGAPVLPDYVITLEREIYHLSPSGKWEDFGDWNLACRSRHMEMLLRYQDALKSICAQLTYQNEVAWMHEDGIFSGLVASNELVMQEVAMELEEACKDFSDWSYQRNTIYLRFCHVDYNKGVALAELCRLLGVSQSGVFAAGDNFNDISMLDGKHAAMCACPANSVEPVKRAVVQASGFVASKNHALGVAESVQYFLEK